MDTKSTAPNFIALLTFYTAEQGGLKTPSVSGDRVKLEFEYNHVIPFAEIEFFDEETVYPGDTAKAKLIITSNNFDAATISVGIAFNFSQGDKTIGKGIINEVVNT